MDAKMKQLYYTSCIRGRSVGGGDGFQIRAASKSLNGEQARAAVRHAEYSLPTAAFGQLTGESPADVGRAPVRLALLEAAEAGRVLCHSVCAGLEPTFGRSGNLFSHVLLALPPACDAGWAVGLWGSGFWRRADGDFGTDLPDVDEVRERGVLHAGDLSAAADAPLWSGMFRFVLSAMLSDREARRIVVAAPARDVALLVYSLCQALPRALRRPLTFSTYEANPLVSEARLIGTCWDTDLVACGDLEEACYAGSRLGYSLYSGRRSAGIVDTPYARFASDALAHGRLDLVRAVVEQCDGLGVGDATTLNLVYRLMAGPYRVAKADLELAARQPAVAAWLAGQVDPESVLALAFEDPAFARGALPAFAAAAAAEGSAFCVRCAAVAQSAGVEALRRGEFGRAQLVAETLLPALSTAHAGDGWAPLREALDDPGSVPWEVRARVLAEWARVARNPCASDAAGAALLTQWLAVSVAQLGPLLELELPESWKVAALLGQLRTGKDLHPSVARWLAGRPCVLARAMERAAAIDESLAAGLFAAADAAEQGGRDGLVSALLAEGGGRRYLPPGLLDRCVHRSLDHRRADALALVCRYGPALAAALAGGASMGTIVRDLLGRIDAEPSSSLAEDPNVRAFLRAALGGTFVDEDTRARLEGWVAVGSFLQQPVLSAAALARTAAGLGRRPAHGRPATLRQVCTAAAAALAERAAAVDVQTELELVLTHFGPLAEGGAAGLFQELLRGVEADPGFWKCPHLVGPFVAAAFGGTAAAGLSPPPDELLEEACRLAEELARRGGGRAFATVERRAASWPARSQCYWRIVARFVRPRGVGELLRSVTPWRKRALEGRGGTPRPRD